MYKRVALGSPFDGERLLFSCLVSDNQGPKLNKATLYSNLILKDHLGALLGTEVRAQSNFNSKGVGPYVVS